MTKNQIEKKLSASNIDLSFVEISRNEVEIMVPEADGTEADWDRSEELSDEVSGILGWGGFRCGYGAWILQNGYRVQSDCNHR